MLNVREIPKTDIHLLDYAQDIFITYFTDLYKGNSIDQLQMSTEVQAYLDTIFEKEKNNFINDSNLFACLAHLDNKIVGFSFFGPIDNSNTILIRTLPINLAYKDIELAIRQEIIMHAFKKFPKIEKTAIMVRKANKTHESFCMQANFKKYNQIYEDSLYIKTNYNALIYNGYILRRSMSSMK